uniref:Uncharacterized protein n=1 Tax=Oryza brachyantha TaxID=4533 RepID=J3MWD0_ORYBR
MAEASMSRSKFRLNGTMEFARTYWLLFPCLMLMSPFCEVTCPHIPTATTEQLCLYICSCCINFSESFTSPSINQ